MKIDRLALRDLSATLDRPIKTLVLNDDTDPFYIGESRMRDAEWFAHLYREYGFGRGVHIRRIHYRIVSQREPIQLPGGGDYVNTVACSKILGEAASSARYAGLVGIEDFEDRRNPAPTLFLAAPVSEPFVSGVDRAPASTAAVVSGQYRVDCWGSFQKAECWAGLRTNFPSFTVPGMVPPPAGLHLYATCPRPYHLEVWCEKSTINDVLEPLARQFSLNLQTHVGEISITRCLELVERTGARPVRILYISDFDPAGQSIPVAAARKIEWFARNRVEPLGIQLHPIVLTHDQCIEYELPRTPIKETEHRAGRFEARFGEGATELDAMEALHPGELRRILVAEIEKFHNQDFVDEWRTAREDAQSAIDEIKAEVFERHAGEAAALEQRREELQALADEQLAELQRQTDEQLADLRLLADEQAAGIRRQADERLAGLQQLADEQFADLRRQADERLAALRQLATEQMADLTEQGEELAADSDAHNAKIEEDLEAAAPDADDFEWPEPPEGWDDPLLDSTRKYVEQIDRYKNHQGKRIDRKPRVVTKLHSLICTICGAAFNAKRDNAKFCSRRCNATDCRNRYRAKNPRGPQRARSRAANRLKREAAE
jgi:hypothetical protein